MQMCVCTAAAAVLCASLKDNKGYSVLIEHLHLPSWPDVAMQSTAKLLQRDKIH